MILLYTNQYEYQFEQTNPSKSLGPYPSITELPSNLLHSLFGELVSNKLPQVRALVLRNTTGSDIVSNVSLYWNNNSESKAARYSMAIEALATPDPSKACEILSSVNNENDCPPSLTFYNNEGVDNALTIPASGGSPFSNNEYYAIWIKREINDTLLDVEKTCAELEAEFSTSEVAQVSTITFPSNPAGILNNQYWLLDTLQNKYYIWYDSSAAGVNPFISGRTGIKVTIFDGDTADALATKTKIYVEAKIPTTEASFTDLSNVLTITNVSIGPASVTNGTLSGASVAILTAGTNYSSEVIEDIDLVISY